MRRFFSNTLGQTTMLTMPVSSSSVRKITPLAVPGRWRTSTRPATLTRRPASLSSQCAALVMTPRRARLLAEEGDRVRLQRQGDGGVVVHDVLAQRRLRQVDAALVEQVAGAARSECPRSSAGCRRRSRAWRPCCSAPPSRPFTAHSAARRSRPMERKASASASRSSMLTGAPLRIHSEGMSA